MAGINLKVQVLRKSVATFCGWLDNCDQLLVAIPTELEKCPSTKLRELAMKYKDLLLQMKERCSYIEKMNTLCKEVAMETCPGTSGSQLSLDGPQGTELADLATQVRDLNSRFAETCLQARSHYTELSNALSSAIQDRESVKSPSVKKDSGGESPEAPRVPVKKKKLKAERKENGDDDQMEILSLERSPVVGRRHKIALPASESPEGEPVNGLIEGRGIQSVVENGHSSSTVKQRSRSTSDVMATEVDQNVVAFRKVSDESFSPDKWDQDDVTIAASIQKSTSIHSLQNRIIYETEPNQTLSSASTEAPQGTNKLVPHRGFLSGSPPILDARTGGIGSLKAGSRLSAPNLDAVCDRNSFVVSDSFVPFSGEIQYDMRSRSMDHLAGEGRGESGGSALSDLTTKLKQMAYQLQEFIHSIAETRSCKLQSLALELHLGEMKAMMVLLELHEFDLVQMRAIFSPSAQKLLLEEKERRKNFTGNNFVSYPSHEVTANRDEILKLTERVEFLHKHCIDTIQQTEEVLEFVTQYEGEIKALRAFLADTQSQVGGASSAGGCGLEESWRILSQALTSINDRKKRLNSVQELSQHLLCLEPLFDGNPIRDDLQSLSSDFDSLVTKAFTRLESQSMAMVDQLLLEVSVVRSWVTEGELSVEALAKRVKKPNGMSTKLAATRKSLMQDLDKRKNSLLSISEKLQPVTAILSPSNHQSLRELISQVEANTKSLKQIESGLKEIELTLVTHDNGSNHSNNSTPPSAAPRESHYAEIDMTALRRVKPPAVKPQQQQPASGQTAPLAAALNKPLPSLPPEDDIPPPVPPGLSSSLLPPPSLPPSTGRVPSPSIGFYRVPSPSILGRFSASYSAGQSSVPLPSVSGQSTFLSVPGQAVPQKPPRKPPLKLPTRQSSSSSSIYERVEELLPSPFVDGELAPSHQLDEAIEQLPRTTTSSQALPHISSSSSSPPLQQQRAGYVEVDVSLYAQPRRLRKGSLHEDLLSFINTEWAGLPLSCKGTSDFSDGSALRAAIGNLGNPDHRSNCQKFLQDVEALESTLGGISEGLSLTTPPATPDLQLVHAAIDKCQTLQGRLDKIKRPLHKLNGASLELLAVLDHTPGSTHFSQLCELRLFDLATAWYTTNMQIASAMRELREREAAVNRLHRELQALSRALAEAKELIAERQSLVDVQDYLRRCKEMHQRLTVLSSDRGRVAADIRASVLTNPQLPGCQELLDQLQQVDTHWVNVARELSQSRDLEPILTKRMFKNINMELKSIGDATAGMQRRSLKREEAEKRYNDCKGYLEKARSLMSSLKAAASRLRAGQLVIANSLSSGQPKSSSAGAVSDEDIDSDQPKSKLPRSDQLQSSGVVNSESSGVSVNQKATTRVDVVISTHGPELTALNLSQLQECCLGMLQQAEKFVSELGALTDVLKFEYTLLEQFHSELSELKLWLGDTRDMLQLDRSSSRGEGEAGGGGGGDGASVYQLRNKHQAICQQLVTRQEKMEMIQSLAADVVLLPSDGAEKKELEKELQSLFTEWDSICQQCVPAGVMPLVTSPTGSSNSFQPLAEFEDISQMIEWLILIESKLQPQRLVVGDLLHLRKQLRDLKLIEKELKLRERDYARFMNGNSVLSDSQSTERGSSIFSSLSIPTYQIPPKCVKFFDENTLERQQRHKEIQNQIHSDSDLGFLELDSQAESSSSAAAAAAAKLNPKSESELGYHSVGPEAMYAARKLEQELNRYQASYSIYDHPRASSQSPSISSQILSPTSPMSDELYQLSILWKGIWAGLFQQRHRLESIQSVWKAFETRKEAFSNFLARAENRLTAFFKVLSTTKDLPVMQAEFAAHKAFSDEIQAYKQRLSALNDLSHDMITSYHSNDDSSDLQDVLADLSKRWRVVMESCSQHQPEVSALYARWGEFYRELQRCQTWLRTMDLEMSNLNPFVSDMESVRLQLEKQKVINKELDSHTGTLETLRLHGYKLLQGVGGCHINAAAVNVKLDNLSRRWDHLQKLAQERKSALEKSLTERQEFLARLANCLVWLEQAEDHLTNQKPLGAEYDTVHKQYQAQQAFWQEVLEQKPKVEAVIALGRTVLAELHAPQSTLEGLRAQYSTVGERWKGVWSGAEQWGRLLDVVHPEMKQFQLLYTECGQRLTEVEMRSARLPPVSTRVRVLEQQLEALQVFEISLVGLAPMLEAMVVSQQRQAEMQAPPTSDLLTFVKRYHQRWTALKIKVEERRGDIEKAMVKYDPLKLGLAELPPGWVRAKMDNGAPYFVHTKTDSKAQWQHPDLAALYIQLGSLHKLSAYPSPAYPIALRLRSIQKETQLCLLRTRVAMEAFEDHTHQFGFSHALSASEMTSLAVDMFQRAEDAPVVANSNALELGRASELSTCWLRDVYDVAHEGALSSLQFQVATVLLSEGKLDDKYKALFQVLAAGEDSLSLDHVTRLLEHVIQVPQLVSEHQYCSLTEVDLCARECFRKYVGVGKLKLPQFIGWLQTEPRPLAWLPVLHRLAAAETARHDVKCSVCKESHILGFRYRCLQCSNFDMCQTCYWSGKSGKDHDRGKHYMEEYCVAKAAADDLKDFFKSLQRSFRRKKKQLNTASAPQVGGADHAPLDPLANRIRSRRSPPVKKRHSTFIAVKVGNHPRKRLSSADDQESHPGRRFTVSEDLKMWRRPTEPAMTHAPPSSSSSSSSDRRRHYTTTGYDLSTSRRGAGLTGRRGPPAKPLRRNRLPPPMYRHRDLEMSLSQLSADSENLSQRLRDLRENRSASVSPQREGGEGGEDGEGGETPEQVLLQHNVMLHGRVQLLQEHNMKLESCISQLKTITSLSPTPSGTTPLSSPHRSPVHIPTLPNGTSH